MALNRSPLMRMLVYPLEAQAVTVRAGFALTDDLRSMMKAANLPQVGKLPPTVIDGIVLQEPPTILTAGAIESQAGLQWWDVTDSTDGTRLAGYTLAPIRQPYNSLVADDFSVKPNPLWHCMPWQVTSGDIHKPFCTAATPDSEPVGVSGVACHSADLGLGLQRVQTTYPLPANQSFHVRLHLLGTGPRSSTAADPHLSLMWGGEWRMYFTPGQPPMLCQRNQQKLSGKPWRVLRTAEDFPDPFGGEIVDVGVYSVAGRLVVKLNDKTLIYTNRESGNLEHPAPVTWRQQPLAITHVGCPYVARVEEVQWGDVDTTLGAVTGSGSFTRSYPCARQSFSAPPKAVALGYYGDGQATRDLGQIGPDPFNLATIVDERDEKKRSQRRYTCTLNGNNPAYPAVAALAAAKDAGDPAPSEFFAAPAGPDGRPWGDYLQPNIGTAMWGSTTPLVHAVAIRQASTTRAARHNPIDLRPALLRATEKVSDPGLQPGAQWTADVERNLLEDCPICEADGTPTGQVVGDNWTSYVKKYHRVRTFVAWRDEFGTDTAWQQRLDGYLMSNAPSVKGVNQWPTTLELRDWIVRLQQPAGLVDGRYAPLDLLAAQIAREGRTTTWGRNLQAQYNLGPDLYAADAIHYILEERLGTAVADSLRVYFDASYGTWGRRRFREAFLSPQNKGGFMWPPPFGSDDLTWIRSLAASDGEALFFVGQAPNADGSTGWAAWYGNYFDLMASVPDPIVLPDANYAPGDNNLLVRQVQVRDEPQVDYNVVMVYANPPQSQTDLGGLFPVLPGYSAEARIQSGSSIAEQNISNTWERTLLIEHPYLFSPEQTSAVALSVARWLRGVNLRHIGITCRGLPALWWGWKIQLNMSGASSDPSLDLDGKILRVMRIENNYNLTGHEWQSHLAVVETPEV